VVVLTIPDVIEGVQALLAVRGWEKLPLTTAPVPSHAGRHDGRSPGRRFIGQGS
jgi:hypothetical protein